MTAADSAPRIRRRVVYFGRVQGVFFRATSAELSRRFDVVGYVRNVPDGTVELEAEGSPDEIMAFLEAIARHFSGHIRDARISELPPRSTEHDFAIRY